MREWTITLSAILCFALQREMDIPFLGRAAAQHPLRPGYLAPTGPALAQPTGRSVFGKQRQTLGGNGMENLCVSSANPSVDRSECSIPAPTQRKLEHRSRGFAFLGLWSGGPLCGNPSSHHRMATAPRGYLLPQSFKGNLDSQSQFRATVLFARRRHLLRASNALSPRIPLLLSMAQAISTTASQCRTYVAVFRRIAFWPVRSGAPPPYRSRSYQTLGTRNRLYVLVSTICQTLRIPQSPHRANWPNFKTLKP